VTSSAGFALDPINKLYAKIEVYCDVS